MYKDSKNIVIAFLCAIIGYIIYMLKFAKPTITVTRIFADNDNNKTEEKNIEEEMKKTYEKMGYTDEEIKHKMDKFEEYKERYVDEK